jgi:hypothetical protein
VKLAFAAAAAPVQFCRFTGRFSIIGLNTNCVYMLERVCVNSVIRMRVLVELRLLLTEITQDPTLQVWNKNAGGVSAGVATLDVAQIGFWGLFPGWAGGEGSAAARFQGRVSVRIWFRRKDGVSPGWAGGQG